MTTKLYWPAENIIVDNFPEVSTALAEPNGLVAIGGSLHPQRLLQAYRHGIFPWYCQGQPIMWWSPDPRCVLFPGDLHCSRSLRKSLSKPDLQVTFDHAFNQVITACAHTPRQDSYGTWITPAIMENYQQLHEQGYAHSVECWYQDQLAGGLYGIALGQIFFGESMFSHITDASKISLVHLVHWLKTRDYKVIDCQVESAHLYRLGAKAIPREEFSALLKQYCKLTPQQDWPNISVY